ncbi:MAG: hypothetical protein ACRCVT_09075 [Leadbetterella sp.]
MEFKGWIIIFVFCGNLNVYAQNTQSTNILTEINSGVSGIELELTVNGGPVKIVGRSAEGTQQNPEALLSSIFRIRSGGYDGKFFSVSSFIGFSASERWIAPNSFGTNINFNTVPNGSFQYNTRMRITEGGKVGIGLNVVPSATLHLNNISNFNTPPRNDASLLLSNSSRPSAIGLFTPKNALRGIVFANPTTGSENGGILQTNDSTLIAAVGNISLNFDGSTGNVGIDEDKPKGKLTIEGDFSLPKKNSLVQGQTHHNLNTRDISILSIGPNSSSPNTETISGFMNGTHGKILHIIVREGSTLILQNLNTNSLQENRIVTHTNADVTISSGGGLTMMYDNLEKKWRVISIAN